MLGHTFSSMEAVSSSALQSQAAAFAVRQSLGQRRQGTQVPKAFLPRHQNIHSYGSSKSIAGQKVCVETEGLGKTEGLRRRVKERGHARAAGTQSPTRERPSVKEAAEKIVGGLGGGLDAAHLDEVAGKVASETGSEKAQISEFLKREYKAGFVTDIQSERIPKGLSEETVRVISAKKNEPDWMLQYRLRAYRQWLKMEEPRWSDNKYPRYTSTTALIIIPFQLLSIHISTFLLAMFSVLRDLCKR